MAPAAPAPPLKNDHTAVFDDDSKSAHESTVPLFRPISTLSTHRISPTAATALTARNVVEDGFGSTTSEESECQPQTFTINAAGAEPQTTVNLQIHICQPGTVATPTAPSTPTLLSTPSNFPIHLTCKCTPPSSSSSQYPTTTPTVPRRSTYPRPSPPTFLYPLPIVPPRVPAPVHPHLCQYQYQCQQNRSSLGKMEDAFSLPIMPVAVQIIVCVSIALGLIWALLVYLANFPPPFLSNSNSKIKHRSDAEKDERKRNAKSSRNKTSNGRGGQGTGRTWTATLKESFRLRNIPARITTALGFGWGSGGGGRGEKKKPMDKPSKYARLRSSSSEMSDSEELGVGDISISSARSTGTLTPLLHTPASKTDTGSDTFELRLRNMHGLRSTSPLGTSQSTDSALSTARWTPAKKPAHPLQDSRPHTPKPNDDDTSTDPANLPPYQECSSINYPTEEHSNCTSIGSSHNTLPPLPHPSFPPLHRRRSSSTWLSERKAFLANARTAGETTDACDSSCQSRSYPSSFDEVGDAEAQIPVSKGNSVLRYLNPRSEGTCDLRRNWSWLDIVDGAVTKAVDRVAKWTENEDGEEGLLLPLAGRGGDGCGGGGV